MRTPPGNVWPRPLSPAEIRWLANGRSFTVDWDYFSYFLFWFRFDFCGAAFVPCVNVLEEGQLNEFRLIGDRNISRGMKIKGGI